VKIKKIKSSIIFLEKNFATVVFLLLILLNCLCIFIPKTVFAGPYDQGIEDAQKVAELPDPESENKVLAISLNILDKLTFYLAMLFVLTMVISGIMFILGENIGQIENAKKWLVYSITGLIISLCAYSIVFFISRILSGGSTEIIVP